MLGIEPRKEKYQKQSVNPLVVGVAGMIAGATAVTAIALTDEDIRKKALKRAKEAKDNLQKWSDNKLHEYKTKNHEADGEEVVEELKVDEKKLQEEKLSD